MSTDSTHGVSENPRPVPAEYATPARDETMKRTRPSVKSVSTAISIALMLLGVLMVCQPFFHTLFRYGFVVTLAGIIAFTIASNLPERHA